MTAPAFSRRLFSTEDGRRPYAYNRLSKIDRDAAAAITLGTDRQANDAEKLAETWEIPGELVHITDAGESASRFRRRERTGWPELLDAINAGLVSVVLVWVWDRIIRDTDDQNALITACRNAGILIIQSASGTVINPDDPDSVAIAKIQGVLAEAEVAKTSKRVRRAHKDIGEKGGFSGGRRRFGYTADMSATVPAEADAIRDAMADILNGVSISAIARRWNAAGLRSGDGNPFSTKTVSALLRGRHLAKIREYDGKEIAASWDAPAIVDATTHAAVVRRLSRNNAGRPAPLHAGRVHKFSGLPLCGECGYPLYGKPSKLKSGPAYSCRNPRRTGPHGQAPVKDVDAVIRAAVIVRLSRLDAAGVFVVEADAEAAQARQAERETLTTRRDEELPDAAALGDYTPAQVRRMTATINARLAELDAADDAETDAVSRPRRVLAGLVALPRDQTAAAYDALPVERQRAVVAELGTPVLRGRNARKGVWDPRRVLVVWDDGRLE